MGCCFATPHQPENHNSGNQPSQPHTGETATSQPPAEGTTVPFRHYTFAELMEATDGFAFGNMISQGGGDLPNFAYRGRLSNPGRIAVKRFSIVAWTDAEKFREAAIKASRLRHQRLVNLIGYCCEGDERLLVAEFMPNNNTLAMHLFAYKYNVMEWSMRLKVACYVAEALEYCSNEGQALYYNLNAHKVLFDEAGNVYLSCFGLVNSHMTGRCYSINTTFLGPECANGSAIRESMIFSFAFLIRDLLTGKQLQQEQALRMILGKKIPFVVDPRLKGNYSTREATALEELASHCLHSTAKDRPTIKEVTVALAEIQNNAAGPSNPMPAIEGQDSTPPMQAGD